MASPLRKAIRDHRFGLALTYFLTLVEHVFELLYPFAIGLAIDGLLAQQGWTSVIPLAAVWMTHVTTGALRQLYDTRLFMRVYRQAATDLIVKQRKGGGSTSAVSARTNMMEEIIYFLEYNLPTIAGALVGIIGSVVMLFIYDALAGVVTLVLLVPVAIVQRFYGKRALSINEKLNDHQEKRIDIVADGSWVKVADHFKDLAKWEVELSDANALVWAVVDLLGLAAVVLVLFRVAGEPGIQAGTVFAALSYMLSVSASLTRAPEIVELGARLVDIRRRINVADDEVSDVELEEEDD